MEYLLFHSSNKKICVANCKRVLFWNCKKTKNIHISDDILTVQSTLCGSTQVQHFTVMSATTVCSACCLFFCCCFSYSSHINFLLSGRWFIGSIYVVHPYYLSHLFTPDESLYQFQLVGTEVLDAVQQSKHFIWSKPVGYAYCQRVIWVNGEACKH